MNVLPECLDDFTGETASVGNLISCADTPCLCYDESTSLNQDFAPPNLLAARTFSQVEESGATIRTRGPHKNERLGGAFGCLVGMGRCSCWLIIC